ncbi:MAG: flagellar filament outer layer protein FlaA [Treponema sp.]|nr:flagellar filament outer layer protein FlaA [Spirochaetia bacterium]MDY2839552.1 flagellar filament outer layer protein FlaA [Treponema sp.]MDY5123585.1 flagellar filament outer layer protein FlaA [Treponema sp.]
MKRGLKVFVGLACLFVIGLPAFSQPSSKSVETFVLENFDSVGEQNYNVNGVSYNWDWAVNASRFVAEGYPKKGYYDGIPNSLKVLMKGRDVEPKVLGVKAAFNRKGDNYFEVYPTVDDKNFEIPFVGTVSQIDFWVWGANYNYFLEVLVRDANGSVHILQAGSLAFHGWKNIIINVPGWLQQQSKLRSGPENMTFVGFRIRSDAEEYVDDFVVFFDQIKYITNSLSVVYDGYELKDANFDDENEGAN